MENSGIKINDNIVAGQVVNTKVAVFVGSTKENLSMSKEFFGSILDQYFKVFDFIKSIFDKRNQLDFNIPEVAIREALVNSYIHRDYNIPSSNIVSIFSDRLEIMSVGGIPEPFTLPDILNGASVCRNPELAKEFSEKGLMTGLGVGLCRIHELYSNSAEVARPHISASPASFLIMISNIKLQDGIQNVGGVRMQNLNAPYLPQNTKFSKETYSDSDILHSEYIYRTNEERVYEYIKTRKTATRKEVELLLGSSSYPALQALNSLVEQGKIRIVGNARSTKYILVGENK